MCDRGGSWEEGDGRCEVFSRVDAALEPKMCKLLKLQLRGR